MIAVVLAKMLLYGDEVKMDLYDYKIGKLFIDSNIDDYNKLINFCLDQTTTSFVACSVIRSIAAHNFTSVSASLENLTEAKKHFSQLQKNSEAVSRLAKFEPVVIFNITIQEPSNSEDASKEFEELKKVIEEVVNKNIIKSDDLFIIEDAIEKLFNLQTNLEEIDIFILQCVHKIMFFPRSRVFNKFMERPSARRNPHIISAFLDSDDEDAILFLGTAEVKQGEVVASLKKIVSEPISILHNGKQTAALALGRLLSDEIEEDLRLRLAEICLVKVNYDSLI